MTLPNRLGTAARPPAPARRSIFAGVRASQPRLPQLSAGGTYRLKVIAHTPGAEIPGKDRYYFSTYEIVASNHPDHGVGDHVQTLFPVTGKGAQSGLARIKAAVVAEAGMTEEEFDAFDPEGEFLDSLFGAANAYSERGDTTVGNLVDVDVSRGNATADGGYYREYSWSPVDPAA